MKGSSYLSRGVAQACLFALVCFASLPSLTLAEGRSEEVIRIIHISDTHDLTDKIVLPKGDILVHTGDFSNFGSRIEMEKFRGFLLKQRDLFKFIIVIAGNHDMTLSKYNQEKIKEVYKKDYEKQGYLTIEEAREYLKDFIYLENSGIELFGLKIWGTPIIRYHPGFAEFGFMLPEEETTKFWEMIPTETDILLTHNPPYEILDLGLNRDGETGGLEHFGSIGLRQNVLERIKPMYHLFGHSHASNGKYFDEKSNVTFVNSAICTDSMTPTNHYNLIEIDLRKKQQDI